VQRFGPIFPYRISFSMLLTRQYNFHCEQRRRRVSRRSALIVVVVRVKVRRVQLVIDPMRKRMFESYGQHLAAEIHHQQLILLSTSLYRAMPWILGAGIAARFRQRHDQDMNLLQLC
jgi:hypothetical protein